MIGRTVTSDTEKADHLLLVDIGSTVIKVAKAKPGGEVIEQTFHDRNYDAEIVDQLDLVLGAKKNAKSWHADRVVLCSSANGGLRVGVSCLTESYSGNIFYDQVLRSGANPAYLHQIGAEVPPNTHVDILLIGGGIDIPDSEVCQSRIEKLDLSEYTFENLVYAGNRFCAEAVETKFKDVKLVSNPMKSDLEAVDDTVFNALRDAYLDDLVHKKGTSDVASRYNAIIYPTPEVVNRGFYECVTTRLYPQLSGTSVLIDIGGATTDIHYTVDVVQETSPVAPTTQSSVSRYVFTDLGVFTSKENTLMQLRRNVRAFDLLKIVLDTDINAAYSALREGEFDPDVELLAYGCVLLALDRFSRGAGPGLPTADFERMDNIAFTGGASQVLDPRKITQIVNLFLSKSVDENFVFVDRNYDIWVRGAVSHREIGAT